MAKALNVDDAFVPVDELAVYLGTLPEVILGRLNGDVQLDWAGRPVVSGGTARRMVEEAAAAEREREARQREAEAAYRRWQTERNAFVEKTRAELERSLKASWARRTAEGFANPEQVERDLFRLVAPAAIQPEVHRRLAEACEKWERRHPAPRSPEEVA